MPAQDKLIRKLNENPPDNFAELQDLMEECGYGVTVTDPSMAMDDDMPDDMPEREMPEDMGPEDEGDFDDMEEGPMSLLSEMMPEKKVEGNDLSPKGRGKMRIQVAKFALKDDKNKREGNYE